METKTVKELKKIAKDLNITGYSKLRKQELIDVIKIYLKKPSGKKPSGKKPSRKKPSGKKERKPCTSTQVRNPATKRCVSKTGKIGRTILGGPGKKPSDTSGKGGWGGGGYNDGIKPSGKFNMPYGRDDIIDPTYIPGDRRYPLIMMLYLSWRHGSDCVVIPTNPLRGMTTSKKTHIYTDMTIRWWQTKGETGYFIIPKLFWNEFKKCKKDVRYIIFPIDSQCTNSNAHANYMIYDSKTKSIERFEPHGSFSSKEQQECHSSLLMDEEMERLIKLNMGKTFLKTYHRPIDFCPRVGPQSIQQWENEHLIKDPKGFCMLWSTWYADVRLSNPDMSRTDVVSKAIEILKKRPESLTKFIRNYTGFFVNIKDELENSNDPDSIIKKYAQQFSG